MANNVVPGFNVAFPKANLDTATMEARFTPANTNEIFAFNPLESYVPGSGLNSLSSLAKDRGILANMKTVGDFEDILATEAGEASTSGVYHNSQFSAADGTAVADYTPDEGAKWTVFAGTPIIQGYKLVGSGSGFHRLRTTIGPQDYKVSFIAKKQAGNDELSLYTRFTDADHLVIMNVAGTTAALYDNVNGTNTIIGAEATITQQDANIHFYEILVIGQAYVAYIDGVEMLSRTLPATNNGNDIGISIQGTGYIDNFRVEAVA